MASISQLVSVNEMIIIIKRDVKILSVRLRISTLTYIYYLTRAQLGKVYNLNKMAMGRVNEYRTMHYFGNPRHTQSMIA